MHKQASPKSRSSKTRTTPSTTAKSKPIKKKATRSTTRKISTTKSTPFQSTNNKTQPSRRLTTTTIPKRFVSIYDMPTPAGQLQQNFGPGASVAAALLGNKYDGTSVHESLQEDVDETISHGSIDFANGRVVFDARSSLHNFVRFRVVEHRKTEFTSTEEHKLQNALSDLALTGLKNSQNKKLNHSDPDNVYYSFQEVYDDGDEEHESPYVNLKSVIKAGSDSVNTLHLSSTAAVVSGVSLSTHAPNNVLYIGNWGGVIPQYMGSKMGADVEILDPDAMSQYMSKTYSPGIFFENYSNLGLATHPRPRIGFTKELPDHPFDIIFSHKMGLLQNRASRRPTKSLSPEDILNLLEQDSIQMSPDQDSTSPRPTPTRILNPDGIENTSYTEQEQEEMDRAHAQLQLEQSVVSFQHARLRNKNTGLISQHPPAIDTHSHLSSLYSQHYLEPTQAIPTAIQYIQHQRHFKHLQSQYEQTQLNIKAMVLEKFNLKPFIISSPDHPHFQIKRQFDLLVQEVASLRFEIASMLVEGGLDSSSSEETEQDDINPVAAENLRKNRARAEELQQVLDQKHSALQNLTQILDNFDPTAAEVQVASDRVSKWLQRRFKAVENFNDKYLELNPEEEGHFDGEDVNDDGEHENDGGLSHKKRNQPFTESLNDCFEENELHFADEFNKQFVQLMIMGQDKSEDELPSATNSDTRTKSSRRGQHSDGESDNGADDNAFADMDGAGDDFDEDAEKLDYTNTTPRNTFVIYERILEDQSTDGVWFQSSALTLDRYATVLKKHQETSDGLQVKLDNLNIDPHTLPVLASIHENILDSIFLPMRGYDVIVHDHNNDPLTLETLRLVKEALIVEGNDNTMRQGMFVKRCSLIDPNIASSNFEGIVDWVPDIRRDIAHIKKVFKHVYWQQPSHDNLVLIATNSEIAGDMESQHPIELETMVDISVGLWQSQAIGLDVVETCDRWNYLTNDAVPNFAKNLVYDPHAFQHAMEEEEM